jgi:hypothetical protein
MTIGSTGIVDIEGPMVLVMQSIVVHLLHKTMGSLGEEKTSKRSEEKNITLEGATGL